MKHKIEIVKLGQQRSVRELDHAKKQLDSKREGQLLSKDAWVNELQLVEREQSITVLIYENYVKEIARVKQKIEDHNRQLEQEMRLESLNKENQENVNNMN